MIRDLDLIYLGDGLGTNPSAGGSAGAGFAGSSVRVFAPESQPDKLARRAVKDAQIKIARISLDTWV